MTSLTWVLLAAAVILAWRLLARRGHEEDDASSNNESTPYHSVSIMTGAGACQTARTLRNVRFLSAEAPLLPLVSCDATRCNCKFAHHADRRRGDRRNAYSAESHGYAIQGGAERRERRGRRQSDGMQIAPGI